MYLKYFDTKVVAYIITSMKTFTVFAFSLLGYMQIVDIYYPVKFNIFVWAKKS